MRGMKLLALIAFVLQGPQRTSPVENDRNDEAASKQFGTNTDRFKYQRGGSARSQRVRMTAVWNTSSMRTTGARSIGSRGCRARSIDKEAVD